MYDINFDETNRLLTYRTRGFWELDDVARFEKDLTAVLMRLRADGRPFSSLIDCRDLPIQSGKVITALAKMSDAQIMSPKGRVAILVTRMINKLQAERIGGDPRIQIFFDEAKARSWLAEPVVPKES